MSLTKLSGRQIETPVDISAVNLTGITTAANLNVTGVSTLSSAIVGSAVTITSGGIVAGLSTVNYINATHVNISGVTTVAAGSTAAPSISPTGDSNTGIFFPSADTIAFGEGGAEALRIDSSGNIGIGTANPGTKLDLIGDIAINGTLAIRRKNHGYDSGYKSVLIGGPDSLSNTVSLCVDVSTISGPNFHGSNQVIIPAKGLLVPNNAGTDFIGVLSRDSSNNLRIGPELSAGITNGPITVTTSNVGIGTDNPVSKLHVSEANSTAFNSSDFDQNYNFLRISNTINDKTAGIRFAIGNNGDAAIQVTETSDGETSMVFGTRGGGSRTEKVRINHSGNVGIGTTNPTSKLYVDGNARITGIVTNAAGQKHAQITFEAGLNHTIVTGITYSSADENTTKLLGNVAAGSSASTVRAIVVGKTYMHAGALNHGYLAGWVFQTGKTYNVDGVFSDNQHYDWYYHRFDTFLTIPWDPTGTQSLSIYPTYAYNTSSSNTYSFYQRGIIKQV